MNYLTLLSSSGQGVNPVKSVGNIFFYVFLAALVIAVVTICLIFTNSKTFKVHLREKIKEKNVAYTAPKLVKVYDEQVKKDIAYSIETEIKEQELEEKIAKENGPKKSDHIIDFKLEEKQEGK